MKVKEQERKEVTSRYNQVHSQRYPALLQTRTYHSRDAKTHSTSLSSRDTEHYIALASDRCHAYHCFFVTVQSFGRMFSKCNQHLSEVLPECYDWILDIHRSFFKDSFKITIFSLNFSGEPLASLRDSAEGISLSLPLRVFPSGSFHAYQLAGVV